MTKKSSFYIITKMLTYAQYSIKYINEVTYEDYINDKRTLIFSVFNLSQLGELVVHIDPIIRNTSRYPLERNKGYKS